MITSHHLSDETIQDYAAGSLSASMETLVACHLTVCCECRKKVELAEKIAGSFFDEAETTDVALSASDIIARASAMPSHATPRAHEVKPESAPIAGVPRPLGRLLSAPLEELDWRRIAPGISQFNLSTQHRRHGAFQLLHLEPGTVLSAHSHNDRELTYMVQGSYTDEIGQFKVGDIADLDHGHHAHQPIVDSDEPCIALIATQSPVRYSGMVGKIMQPFVGI